MKAILSRDGRAALSEVPVPEIGDGELLLALDVCGLCGTDVMKLDTRAKGAPLRMTKSVAFHRPRHAE